MTVPRVKIVNTTHHAFLYYNLPSNSHLFLSDKRIRYSCQHTTRYWCRHTTAILCPALSFLRVDSVEFMTRKINPLRLSVKLRFVKADTLFLIDTDFGLQRQIAQLSRVNFSRTCHDFRHAYRGFKYEVCPEKVQRQANRKSKEQCKSGWDFSEYKHMYPWWKLQASHCPKIVRHIQQSHIWLSLSDWSLDMLSPESLKQVRN